MAIVGLNLAATKKYQSVYDPDRGKDGATEFELGTLDSRTHGYIKDMSTKFKVDTAAAAGGATEEVETSLARSEVAFVACQFGIKNWKNLKDSDGSDIKPVFRTKVLGQTSYKVVADDVLRHIPQVVLQELADEILSANDLKAVEGNA